jgi:hypothetical protein
MAGSAKFTTVPSRNATIDTMTATTMILLVGAALRRLTLHPADTDSYPSPAPM